MADSDYTTRGTGPITPTAYLSGTLSQDPDAPVQFYGFSSSTGVLPTAGASAMIDDEIVKVVSITEDGDIVLERGCADTIPQVHAAKTIIYFLDDAVGTDNREYMATETIGVKVLMRTNGAPMAVRSSPPNALTFNARFARPYPPGNVYVGASRWYAERFELNLDNPSLLLQWAHRDRVTQDDQLYGHSVGSIGPEAGVTYRLSFYNDADGLAHTEDGITGTSLSLSLVTLMGYYSLLSGDPSIDTYVLLYSMREGIASLQPYRIDLRINPNVETGWGSNWGESWGN